MKTMGIYKIEHMASGDCYIGGSINISARWASHKCDLRGGTHGNVRLQRVWSTNGEKSFAFLILEIVEERGILLAREQHWMDRINPKFNIQRVAGSSKGQKPTAETKAKISAGGRGLTRSAETRAKISASNRTRIISAATKARMSAAGRGRTPSAETRAKMSAAGKNKVLSPEHRAKIAEANRARSPETLAKITEARVAYWARKKELNHAS